ncbi:hypothetical protein BpHYR1_008665 [Brachionus plicatilis]|uniref:Uncharacterized protein n=1 Tax=Brachionus plicatilis TaxID=10195 RepID=A0A3M7TAH2_BRAPC|nr:hypothetical protein BpHYR1_008665 [Brachionus plicatilis]
MIDQSDIRIENEMTCLIDRIHESLPRIFLKSARMSEKETCQCKSFERKILYAKFRNAEIEEITDKLRTLIRYEAFKQDRKKTSISLS